MRRGDQGPLPLRRECTAVVCRKRQPLCDLREVTGTGKAPAEQLAVPWRRQTTLPDGCPTGPKRPDSRDGRPNPRPRRLTKGKDRRHLVPRHAEIETKEMEPPLDTVKTPHRR